MMKFLLGAYWDARPDSLEKCTDDAGRFFAGLAEIDPLLAHWYERGDHAKMLWRGRSIPLTPKNFRTFS